ncbi:hypothetical protein GEU84_009460 [Fertoebacter nigrum]|uniref:Uncharacterized protein n=1 Tax=Fertoeibacter niger TaxID=2656921 RepID=A0A8X8GZB4_9RHOB|nr:hypothetical protein [Fertoeibacter niger]NUB44608.1 hypothetical protein [Fertoeibacter niger]
MTRRAEMARLAALSGLILDLRLAELSVVAQAREASLAHLRALVAEPGVGLDPLPAAQAALRYQHWADQRRAAINLMLARQTAAWQVAQDEARRAFGRAETLAKIQTKLEKELRSQG